MNEYQDLVQKRAAYGAKNKRRATDRNNGFFSASTLVHPLLVVFVWIITCAFQWGTFTQRMSAIEQDVQEMHNDVRMIQRTLMRNQ